MADCSTVSANPLAGAEPVASGYMGYQPRPSQKIEWSYRSRAPTGPAVMAHFAT